MINEEEKQHNQIIEYIFRIINKRNSNRIYEKFDNLTNDKDSEYFEGLDNNSVKQTIKSEINMSVLNEKDLDRLEKRKYKNYSTKFTIWQPCY